MRFFSDSTEEHWVRWYACDKNAKPLPGPTVFNSTRWLDERFRPLTQGLGEVLTGHRPWSHGRNTDHLPGTCYLGTLAQYAGGLVQQDRLFPRVIPDCCKPLDPEGIAVRGIGKGPIEDWDCGK